MGQAKRRTTKFDPKLTEAAFSRLFCCRVSNIGKRRSEVVDDVISAVAVDWVGVDVPVKFGDSMLNSDRIMRLFVGRTSFSDFCAVDLWGQSSLISVRTFVILAYTVQEKFNPKPSNVIFSAVFELR